MGKTGAKLAAQIIIQNEAPYLLEWIEFHRIQGFDHFIIYDNGSTDGFQDLLLPYLASGIVHIVPIADHRRNKAPAFWCYLHAFEYCREQGIPWMWIASIDEYVFARDGKPIAEILPEFDGYAGVAISWVLFNSSGHEKKTPGLVIERFTEAYPEEPTLHIKSIVKPERVTNVRDPHSVWTVPPFIVVNEKKEPCPSAHPGQFSADRLVIHHYHVMSREEFDIKMNKGRCDIAGLEGMRRAGAAAEWARAHGGKGYKDESLLPYVPLVKQRLGVM